METCEIDGYTIPSGTRVMVNAWAIGRLSSHWENPDEFMPERFVDANDVIDLKRKDFRYLPFGSGRRMCPGIHAAAATLEIMLANLMCCSDWELPAGMKKEDIDMTEIQVVRIVNGKVERMVDVPFTLDDGTGRLDFIKVGD
nr:unnamed protein product [Digitaria exilis]